MFLVATYYFLFSGFVGSGSESFDTDTDLDPAQLFIRIRNQENYTDSADPDSQHCKHCSCSFSP